MRLTRGTCWLREGPHGTVIKNELTEMDLETAMNKSHCGEVPQINLVRTYSKKAPLALTTFLMVTSLI